MPRSTETPSPPLTAGCHKAPGSYDESTVFTFELRFSATSSLDQGTLGTTLTTRDVIGARRLEPPGNVSWQITVRRYSDSDVTVARTHLGRPFPLTRALSHEERWDAHHLPVPSVEAPACRGTTWGVLGMTPWSNMLLS